MIELPEFEWSASGLSLLQEIKQLVIKYGGRGRLLLFLQGEHHKGYACSKLNCEFCYQLHRRIDEDKEITFRNPPRVPKRKQSIDEFRVKQFINTSRKSDY